MQQKTLALICDSPKVLPLFQFFVLITTANIWHIFVDNGVFTAAVSVVSQLKHDEIDNSKAAMFVNAWLEAASLYVGSNVSIKTY